MENATSEQQTNGPANNFERFDNRSSQNHIIENSIDDEIRRAVDDAVLTVENCMHAAILTAVDKMVIPRVETAVRLTTGSTGRGLIRDVQNPDRRYFWANVGIPSLRSASSQLDVNTNQNRNDETRNEEDFEDGDFLAFRPSYDRTAPTHHTNDRMDVFSVEHTIHITLGKNFIMEKSP